MLYEQHIRKRVLWSLLSHINLCESRNWGRSVLFSSLYVKKSSFYIASFPAHLAEV